MTDDYAGYGEIMERLTEERDQLRATLEQIAASLEVASVVPTNPENEPDRESGGVAGAGNEPGTEATCGDHGW